MANYYKAKILNVGHDPKRDDDGKPTGELQPYIEFEVLVTRKIKIDNAQHMQVFPYYEQNLGKVVMITADEGVFNGNAWMKLRGDGVPLMVSVPDIMPVSSSSNAVQPVALPSEQGASGGFMKNALKAAS